MSAAQDLSLLPRIEADSLPALAPRALDSTALSEAREILQRVTDGGALGARREAERLGDLAPGAPMVVGPEEMAEALAGLDSGLRGALERTAQRVRAFALAQRAAIADFAVPIPGGMAGVEHHPLDRAGCYAPGGRFPLPSSVLMTAIPARVAGVREVWVASPRPAQVTMAAASLAGADGMLTIGGAQAIGGLAYGLSAAGVPAVDIIVGPGNRWVTAAKHLVSATVRIDMLAGPSELLVIAGPHADPRIVAADLLAQAEHDPAARPMLVALEAAMVDRVREEAARQLLALPTAAIARTAMSGGFAIVARDLAEAVALANRIAPEHLSLQLCDAQIAIARRGLHAYGALFVGGGAAEALGDYGTGPNHVLPTGGTARARGGLSVLDFLCARSWMRLDSIGDADGRALVADAALMARAEGLEGHARSAELRAGHANPGTG